MRAPCAGTHMQRTTVTCTPAHQRAKLVISCSNQPIQPKSLQQLFVRCAASTQRLWSAAAGHQQQRPLHSNRRSWQQSLCIGAGAGAVACSGSGGGFEPPGSGGWGSGGGGGGWGQTPGSSSPGSNVLAEVAAAGDVSEAAVEEVILLDIGGMKCGGCVGHVKQLLEQHAAVSAATVNLATETALVRVKLEAGADLSTLAAELAKVLTAAGFPAAVSKKSVMAAQK